MSTEISIREGLLSSSSDEKLNCGDLDTVGLCIINETNGPGETTKLTESPNKKENEDIAHPLHSSDELNHSEILNLCSSEEINEDEKFETLNPVVNADVTIRDDHENDLSPPPKSNTCENCGQELVNKGQCSTEIANSLSNPSVFSASLVSSADICRICHCERNSNTNDFIAPCKCKGSLTYVHHSCLQLWIQSSGYKRCELCGFHFTMNSKLKPLSKWKKLSMSKAERRKICCSVFFHVIAITCVIWSLYVLIERTAAELERGLLQWTFWAKLTVVAIGLMGGLVFMYVQCKVYIKLWQRLKSFNRIVYVQDQPTHNAAQASNQNANALSNNTLPTVVTSNDNRCDQSVDVV